MSNGDTGYDRTLEILLAYITEQLARLKQQVTELETARQALQTTLELKPRISEMIKAQVDMQPLTKEDAKNPKRVILKTIGVRNNRWLIVQSAIKLMTEAGVLSEDPTSASAEVYTILGQNAKEFVKVAPGIYWVTDDHETASPIRRSRAKTGLVAKVEPLMASHPDWKTKELCEQMQRDGWDFGDKNPIFSVGMAYANIIKRRNKVLGQPLGGAGQPATRAMRINPPTRHMGIVRSESRPNHS